MLLLPLLLATTTALPLLPAVPSTATPAATVVATQFHSQDELGNFSFGYRNPTSAREERGDTETGVTTGAFTLHGNIVRYVADNHGVRFVV